MRQFPSGIPGHRFVRVGALGLALAASASARAEDVLNQVPGRLVDVGSHQLHIDCAGNLGPTVVIEAGLAGFSLEWREVQRRVAGDLRVCLYDRAGYGWSERGPEPRTAARIADELARLLRAAGERPPYVLVGHSFGGYVIRRYAARHPNEIHGLVFVDASQPEQHALLPLTLPNGVRPRARAGMLPHARVSATPRLPAGFPEALATTAMRLMMKPGARETQWSELEHFAESAGDVGPVSDLPRVPIVVLSRAARVTPGVIDAAGRDELTWAELQAGFARRTPGGSHFVVEGTGHHIHLERPDRVAEAIRGVVVAARYAAARDGRETLAASLP